MVTDSIFTALRACFLLLATLLSYPSLAQAGPVEQLTQVALHPYDPNVQVVRYLNGRGGLLYTADGGTSWKLLCSSHITRPLSPTALAIATDGRTLIGTTSGLWQDDGAGCAWSKDPALEGRYVSDVVLHPSDPERLFVVTANAAAGSSNGILTRSANGDWASVGAQTPLSITRLRITPTPAGVRFYESAQMGGAALIRVSDDEGQNWQEFPIVDADPSTSLIRLQAVDPTQPDRIVISVERPEADDQVLVSNDRGETFAPYLSVTELSGVLMSDDGRVWVSDSGGSKNDSASEGIWYAPNLDASPQRIFDQQTRCLSRRPDEDTLYACLRWKYGPVDLEAQCVDSSLEMYRVQEMVECAGVDMAAACEAQLCEDYCRFDHFPKTPLCGAYKTDVCGPAAAVDGVSLGTSDGADSCGEADVPDGGMPSQDAGSDGPTGGQTPEDAGVQEAEPNEKESSSCSATPSPKSSLTTLTMFGVLAAAFAVRGRRRNVVMRGTAATRTFTAGRAGELRNGP